MEYVVRDAPASADAYWRVYGDTLVIWINPDLDSVTKRRYIEQAKREKGIASHRRGLLLPLPFIGDHKPALIGTAGTVAVAGLAAVFVLPAVLDGDQGSAGRTPGYAAPAPTRPGPPPSHDTPPTPKPKPPPHQPDPPPVATTPGPVPGRVDQVRSISKPPVHIKLPGAKPPPVKNPPVSPPPTPPPVALPPPTRTLQVRVHVTGLVDARVGIRLPAIKRPVVPSAHADPEP